MAFIGILIADLIIFGLFIAAIFGIFIVVWGIAAILGGIVLSGKKQEVNLGRKNNQNFVSIPFNNLISKIRYKAELKGIKVIETEESYTSKCSFFDDEFPCKQESYKGERVHRGLFRSSLGLINADLNGALNIIKKKFKDFSSKTSNLSIDFFKTVVKVDPKFTVSR